MLRKISKILYLVGGIVSFVVAGLLLFSGITTIVLGSVPMFRDYLADGIANGTITSTIQGTPTEIATYIQISVLATGIICLIIVLLSVANGILSLMARKTPTKYLAILNIVFGVLSDIGINIAASVLALIANKKEENNKVIDAE